MAQLLDKPEPDHPEEYGDFPLNYYDDQLPDIKPQLRRVDLKLAFDWSVDNLSLVASGLLLAGTLGFLLKRKFALASFLAAGLAAQQVFNRIGGGDFRGRMPKEREKTDLSIERYALKAQKGDYGKMEVIPFR
jgi:hypothetical protein